METADDLPDEGKPLPDLARRGYRQDISGCPAVTRSTTSVEGGVLAPSTAHSHGPEQPEQEPNGSRFGSRWPGRRRFHAERRLGAPVSLVGSAMDHTQIGEFWVRWWMWRCGVPLGAPLKVS